MNRRCMWRPAFFLTGAILLLNPAAAADRWLSGVTRDALGALLSQVEVVVLAEGASLPLTTTKTDAQGRFLFEGLAPAVYRVAGFKDGYLVAVGRVNTSVRNSLDLVLKPVPVEGEPGSERVPANQAWVLRLPERGPLRDLPGIDVTGDPDRSAQTRRGRDDDTIRGRVDQLFTVGNSPSSGGSADLRQGSETRVELASALGNWGSARVAGRHEALDGGASGGGPGAASARRGSDVQFDLQVDPTADSKLRLNGRYLARQATAGAGDLGPVGNAERSWGWDALWSSTVGAASRFDVRFEYSDTNLSNDGPLVPADRRSALAAGRFEAVAGGGHQVQVDLQAAVRDGAVASRAAGEFRAPVLASDASMYVNLSAEDLWSLNAHGGLVHGLEVLHVATASQSFPVVVPKLGAFWRGDRATLRAEATYFADLASGGAPAVTASLMSGSALGYSGLASVSLPFDLSLSGGLSVTPLLLGGGSGIDGSPAASELYVTDGFASSHEVTAAIDRTTSRWTVYATQSAGRVEGHVAPVPLFAGPGAPLSVGRIDYRATRIGMRFPAAGTDLSVRYQSAQSPDPVASSDTAGKLVEARLSQDLGRLRLADTAWRFLLVGRTATEGLAARAPAGTARNQSRAREMSAGLAVAF